MARTTAVVCFILFLVPGSALAEGRLDPTFGSGGLTSDATRFPGTGGGVDLSIGPDGSFFVGELNDGVLSRFRSGGGLDRRFGRRGTIRLGAETARRGLERPYLGVTDMAADRSGRLVVFAAQTDGEQVYPSAVPPKRFALVLRLGRNGHLDHGFGGRGFVRSDFGLRSEADPDIPGTSAMAGGVDPQDRPVLLAGSLAVAPSCGGHTSFSVQPRAVVRLTAAGTPDPGFGEGDGVSPIEGTTSSPGFGLDEGGGSLASVGRIGGPSGGCESGTTLFRLDEAGERASDFGADGVAVLGGLHFSFMAPSGATVFGGRDHQTLRVLELDPGGDSAPGFGDAGEADVRLPFKADTRSSIRPVALDSSGRVLLAGFVDPPPSRPARRPRGRSALVVARLGTDGQIDRSFGHGGWLITRLPKGEKVNSSEAALDPAGRLLLATTVIDPPARHGGFAVARYLLGP